MKLYPGKDKEIKIINTNDTKSELVIEYEFARRFGGENIDVSCAVFSDESFVKTEKMCPVDIPSVKFTISKAESGIRLIYPKKRENGAAFDEFEDTFDVSDEFVEKYIRLIYEEMGYSFEAPVKSK